MPQNRLEMLSENPRAYLSFEIWIKVLLEIRGAFFVYIRIEEKNGTVWQIDMDIFVKT